MGHNVLLPLEGGDFEVPTCRAQSITNFDRSTKLALTTEPSLLVGAVSTGIYFRLNVFTAFLISFMLMSLSSFVVPKSM